MCPTTLLFILRAKHSSMVFEKNKKDFEYALKNDALKLCSDKLDDEVAEIENP